MNLIDVLQATQKAPIQRTIRGTVLSVDATALTCVVQPLDDDAALIEDVDLALGMEGVIPIPSVDSLVVVQMENDFTGYLATFSGLDELRLLADKVTFNGDGNSTSTLVVIELLVQRMNTLETAYNALLTSYKNHVHASSGAPITVPLVQNPLQLTMKEDIENPNITQ